jgi:hypothetical protein
MQGGTLDTVPAARACRFERAWEGDGTVFDPDFRMEPSYRVMVEYLAAGLDIRVSSPVKSIAVDTAALAAANAAAAAQSGSSPATAEGVPAPALPSKHAITVTCADGSVVHAHRVVVTVPLPIMRDEEIAFSPPLAPHKVAAAKSLSFANGVKILLKFSRRPWPADCHGAVCANTFVPECWMNSNVAPAGALIVGKANYTRWFDEDVHAAEDDSEEAAQPAHAGGAAAAGVAATDAAAEAAASALASRPDREPGGFYICTGFTMGERADAIAALPQSVVIARFLSQLDRMFGCDATGAFVAGYVHSWAKEPYIRGAYAAVTSDAHTDAARAMAEPHLGAVFFAGEATAGAIDGELRAQSIHFASPIVLHGAMATGSAAACDVARSLGMPVVCQASDHAHQLAAVEAGVAQMSVGGASTAAGVPCSRLRRLRTAEEASSASGKDATSRGAKGLGYVTPIVPVSYWRSPNAAVPPLTSPAAAVQSGAAATAH